MSTNKAIFLATAALILTALIVWGVIDYQQGQDDAERILRGMYP